MKGKNKFLMLFIGCLLIQSLQAIEYLNYTNCFQFTKYLYQTDSYSITWSPPVGQTSCNLAMDFNIFRDVTISTINSGGTSTRCRANPSAWKCSGSALNTSCPVLMYSYSKIYPSGKVINGTISLRYNYVNLQYCDDSKSNTSISIYVHTSSNKYFTQTATWGFIRIGIPVVGVAVCGLLWLVFYSIGKYKKHRFLRAMEQNPAVTFNTASGSTNLGFNTTPRDSQPIGQSQQLQPPNNDDGAPPPYIPREDNEDKNIQEALK